MTNIVIAVFNNVFNDVNISQCGLELSVARNMSREGGTIGNSIGVNEYTVVAQSSCSHIYYPESWSGTNEYLIVRVGARSI